jgi:glutamyl-tRNA synthetase
MAPSPTGVVHIGLARAALFNWAFAKRHNGAFILRIEDTDVKRNIAEAVQAIIDGFAWLGMVPDEGPYYQSQRLDIYNRYIDQLLKEGKAYVDVDEQKGECIRLRMPAKRVEYDDLILGHSGWDLSLIGDLVLRKSDGYPTYNYAVVIDDHDMNISHVIRGMEHFSNVPKQVALYEAFGWTPPQWAHVPLLMGPDGKKLSKRKDYGGYEIYTDIADYRRIGYLPEALGNFLLLMGWSPGEDIEIMSWDYIIQHFDLARVVKTHSQVNYEKMLWMNGKYIRAKSVEELAEMLKPFMRDAGFDPEKYDTAWLRKIIALFHDNLNVLGEFPQKAKYFLVDEVQYDDSAVKKFLAKEGVADMLKQIRDGIAAMEPIEHAPLEAFLKGLADKSGQGFGKIAQPVRVAITGGAVSPGIFETIDAIGKAKVLNRLDHAISNLCVVKK